MNIIYNYNSLLLQNNIPLANYLARGHFLLLSLIYLCNDLGGLQLGKSGDVYGYYKNGQLVGFKSQADIDAAYQSGYTDGQAAGETTHTGTKTITNPSNSQTIDLGIHHTYRYINIVYTIVPWSTGNINSIKAMCNTDSINVADYWAIGDTRRETSTSVLGSTYQKWVLTDFNSTTSGGTVYNAIIHTLDLYPTSAPMNSNNSNITWNKSVMRTSTMSSIYNSLNSSFKPLIKTVSNITGFGNNSTGTSATSDQIWLFSEREVTGAKNYTGTDEYTACKQFKYFETVSNRAKTGNSGNTAGYWWLRSPYISNSTSFCNVSSSGTVLYTTAITDRGVCVAAAI